jgi:dUTP pyrophosphatase
MTTLRIWKTNPAVQLPKHQTAQSACFDLAFQTAGKNSYKGYSHMNKPFSREMKDRLTIAPGERALIPTGCIMDIPEGFSVRLHARSGTSLKQGLVLANAEGVIDSDYVEEVFIILHNISGNAVTIENGDRIAQAELVKNVEYTVEETPARPLPKTSRAGGFGSTGITNQHNMVVINIPETKEVEVEPPVKRGRGRPKGSTKKK